MSIPGCKRYRKRSTQWALGFPSPGSTDLGTAVEAPGESCGATEWISRWVRRPGGDTHVPETRRREPGWLAGPDTEGLGGVRNSCAGNSSGYQKKENKRKESVVYEKVDYFWFRFVLRDTLVTGQTFCLGVVWALGWGHLWKVANGAEWEAPTL